MHDRKGSCRERLSCTGPLAHRHPYSDTTHDRYSPLCIALHRLGVSLGADIIPRKVCSLDCVYCEVGHTTRYAVAPEPFTPVREVADEIGAALRLRPDIDWVTFSGSGEPTLNVRVGEMIREVRKRTSTPVAVITNGTLLWNKDVRKRLMEADAVLPSLDAATQAGFERNNKPDPLLDISTVIEGLKSFRQEFRGKFFLEILLVRWINDSDEENHAFKRAVGEIRPDKIHLNTVVRPPAETWASPVGTERMQEIAAIIGNGCEIIAASGVPDKRLSSDADDTSVLRLLARRPMKEEELRAAFQAGDATMGSLLKRLLAERKIVRRMFDRGEFFAVREGE